MCELEVRIKYAESDARTQMYGLGYTDADAGCRSPDARMRATGWFLPLSGGAARPLPAAGPSACISPGELLARTSAVPDYNY